MGVFEKQIEHLPSYFMLKNILQIIYTMCALKRCLLKNVILEPCGVYI